MSKTRDELNALVAALPVTDALKAEFKSLLDELEDGAFDRGQKSMTEESFYEGSED
jgi:hypothetical protein